MFNELERLRDEPGLYALLNHYAELGAADRQAWLDRRMTLEGADARHLSRLHGELMAHGWLEQNTGVVPAARPDEVPGCYRVTREGARALKKARQGGDD